MRRFPAHLLLPAILAAFSPVMAQDASFTASVDNNRTSMGGQIQITFTLNGSTGGSDFRPPSFDDFLTLSGPNQSTNMQFINGVISSSVSYSYVLQPRSGGTFTIGPASITSGGKELRTQPVRIEVAKGAAPPPRNRQQQGDQDITKEIADNLFLRATVDKSRVVQGEQVTVTYKLYTRVGIANYGITRNPALTGFWSEDLEVARELQLTNEVVNGKQYRVGVLKKTALFPQRSGELEIDPMEAECVVQVQARRKSNDIFDQFFSDPFFGNVRNVNTRVRSDPVRVAVAALPVAGVPPGFNGAVGRYTMEAWIDKRETKANEPVMLKVKISGRGNLKLIDAPAVAIPPDMEKYDPKIADNIARQGNSIAGSRTFETLLIPRHPGDQKIPSFPFSYFDDEKKSYVTLRSPDFVVSVGRGSDAAAAPVAGLSKEEVKLLGEDIRFIKGGGEPFRRRGEMWIGSAAFLAAGAGPFLAFAAIFIYAKRRRRAMGDLPALRNRRAQKVAKRRLASAEKFLKHGKREEFTGEVSRALWGYVSDKLGLPPAGLSLEAVRSTLEARGVPSGEAAGIAASMGRCDEARYAPSASFQMDALYREALDLISSVEDHVR